MENLVKTTMIFPCGSLTFSKSLVLLIYSSFAINLALLLILMKFRHINCKCNSFLTCASTTESFISFYKSLGYSYWPWSVSLSPIGPGVLACLPLIVRLHCTGQNGLRVNSGGREWDMSGLQVG